ncbi:hypothetical protein [Streptacidiphilus jiangxiensis]|uniref:Uncharacterized protein n=1 Tax=Streptacidiphilus jiangxiensis TaxID=235985 RepID=A0A1H7JNL6_STRJI|nr:hypothetical protein [Streptacidiphilus jiangxiensis]SEK76191.1 hypothetical protein SAMN05414137_103384 [Streptacidiphilus jiangxiensis]
MTRGLLRYHSSLALRSHGWLPPLTLLAFLLLAGRVSAQQYGDALGWCAAVLVPVCGWLTRAVVSAEPDAAAAVVAAAAGARAARASALAVGLGGGLLLGAVGAAFEVAASSPPSGPHASTGAVVADGLVAVLVGVLAGTAAGALPVRGRAAGVLTLTAGSLALLVASVSPVNAAVRQTFTSQRSGASTSLPWLALLEACVLLTACAAAAVRVERY